MNSGGRRLSKSAYKDGVKCPKRLWLRWNQPDLGVVDEAMLARAEIGQKIGILARGLNPGGVEVPGDSLNERLENTAQMMRDGHRVLYEAAFAVDGLFAQVDILFRIGEAWGFREVKSAKTVNDNHVKDAIFQYHVLNRSGLSVERVELIFVAQETPMIEGSRVQDLFVPLDVTDICRRESPELPEAVNELLGLVESGEAEKIRAGRHCEATCPYLGHCFGDLADDDLLFAPSLDKRKYQALVERGIYRMSQVPADEELSNKAEFVRRALGSGRVPWVAPDLGRRLAAVKYPAVFLDFETASPLFPVNMGMKGGELVVFQFSAHVLSEPGGDAAHFEFVDLESDDPHLGLVEALTPVLAGAGSVIHYSAFEKRCLTRLVGAGVPGAQELLQKFLASSVDMEDFFKDGVYHPKFRGKSSIKVVLPVMVPGLDYSDLLVKNGGMAEMSYVAARSGELVGADLAARREALLRYCERDTFAMVKLFEALLGLV